MWSALRWFRLFWFSALISFVLGQGSSTLWTSFIPLAVRSPYLNAWQNTSNVPFTPSVQHAPTVWPVTTANLNLGWTGLIRIDNSYTFKWLGDSGVPANLNRSVLTNIQLTPTRTILNMTAGPIDMTVTFLSPIESADLVKQSLPFTYLSVEATSNDGLSHVVQIYSDTTAEWLSGNRKVDTANSNVIVTDAVIAHEMYLVDPRPFSESMGQVLDTTTFYGAQMSDGVSYMVDEDATCRGRFNTTGVLTGEITTGPGVLNNPVYAIVKDLGTVTSTTAPFVWALGMLRDPAIAYTTPNNTNEQRPPYWRSMFNTPQDAATALIQDWNGTYSRAVALDMKILKEASTVSSNFADLLSLTARQAMAGTELTISQSNGQYNTSDVKMFMKNMGSVSPNRVNPVEVLYKSFPAFLYINASYGGYLLEPILEYSSSGLWPFDYAPADLGLNYPNATGNNQPHNEGVEQTGNMLIMTLAYARASGDGAILSRYYKLLQTWADYLVNNTLPVPTNQITADGISRANSTNLAIKGIIGIQAMAQVSEALKMEANAQHYSNIASGYASTWRSLALSADSSPQHILSNYGENGSSWTLPYNLFADKWLQTGLVSDSLYSSETIFLNSLDRPGINGLAIDSFSATADEATGDTAWTLFVAALVSNSSVRDNLISPIWTHASSNRSDGIFPTEFILDESARPFNDLLAASPGVGGIFAPLALTMPNVSISVPATSGSTPEHASRVQVGVIVGAVVGGIGVPLLLVCVWLHFRRRSRSEMGYIEKIEEKATPDIIIPFEYTRLGLPENPQWEEPGVPRAAVVLEPTVSRKSAKAAESQLQQSPVRHTPTASSSADNTTRSVGANATATERSPLNSPQTSVDVHGLRAEVEELRRVMHYLHNDRLDPPPLYEGEGA